VITGAIAGAVLLPGISMMLAGLRRKGTKAKQRRAERKEARNAGRDRDKAQEENDKLRRRLDHDADAHSSGATAAGEKPRHPGTNVTLTMRSHL
jgi:hypothetical protein